MNQKINLNEMIEQLKEENKKLIKENEELIHKSFNLENELKEVIANHKFKDLQLKDLERFRININLIEKDFEIIQNEIDRLKNWNRLKTINSQRIHQMFHNLKEDIDKTNLLTLKNGWKIRANDKLKEIKEILTWYGVIFSNI